MTGEVLHSSDQIAQQRQGLTTEGKDGSKERPRRAAFIIWGDITCNVTYEANNKPSGDMSDET